MKHGTYIGPLLELQGKTALLRRAKEIPQGFGEGEPKEFWVAQFDDLELKHPVSCATLGLDWRRFVLEDFELDEEVDDETNP
jgi:hypothetical protein